MQLDRGIIRVGLEIEVADWKNDYSFLKVCEDLVEAKYMLGPVSQWEERHTYHCNCGPGGCGQVRKANIIVPPLVSMTYDASLPATGAEFIVSPVLLGSTGLDFLKEIWNIVTVNANWNDKLEDINGNFASPSVHLHVSATAGDISNHSMYDQLHGDTLHALSLFSPELFVLADIGNYRRGLTYRLPSRAAIHNDLQGFHHGFVHVRRMIPDVMSYIEWRLFEADYENWQYVESAAYLSAVITRALLPHNGYKDLMRLGYAHPYDENLLDELVRDDAPSLLYDLLDLNRLHGLRAMCESQLDDDHYGQQLVAGMFDKVEASL